MGTSPAGDRSAINLLLLQALPHAPHHQDHAQRWSRFPPGSQWLGSLGPLGFAKHLAIRITKFTRRTTERQRNQPTRPKTDWPDGLRYDGTPSIEGKHGSTDIGVYSSLTTRKGNNVLWHPDRKFHLVGRKRAADFLADLKAPAWER